MTKNFYSIFDNVAGLFNKPFDSINNATAIREFSSSVSDAPHKNDYVLYHLGQFDDCTGDIRPNENPLKIFSGLEVDSIDSSDVPMLNTQAQ